MFLEDINMHDAKNQLSELVRETSSVESFLLANTGKPIVKVENYEEPKETKRLGFMLGEGKVPDNFNSMGSSEIESMFYENK